MAIDETPWAIFTDLVLETFRFNGRLLAAGDVLTEDLGLSSARWQVLGAIELADRPPTVPQIARTMGVTRQGVQRIADLLIDQGVLETVDNPEHRRAKLIRLTARGQSLLNRVAARQKRWAERVVRDVDRRSLHDALSVLHTLRARLEEDGDDALGAAVKEKSHAKVR